MKKPIIDVCCGSRMFWFNKQNPNCIFMDNREVKETLCDGRQLVINPDIIGDFRNISFGDNSFNLVVFDPPHLLKVGEKSWLFKKYGKLSDTWKEDLKQGFEECFRILKPGGVLVFKWNEEQIKLSEIIKLSPSKPLIGHKRQKTHFLIFMKIKESEEK